MRERLRTELLSHGGTLASAVAGSNGDGDADEPLAAGPAQLAARGPRTAGREAEYELLLEMILEGSLLHYGSPRVVACHDDDLALLLGDQLYALGLSRLAALGDLEAVAELGDLISLVAQAHADSDPALADAVWRAGAAAIGWGSTPEHRAAKELARAGDGRATAALEAACDELLAEAEGVGK